MELELRNLRLKIWDCDHHDLASLIAIIDDIFLGFVFSFFFCKHQKIFFGKFFEMQPNTEKYFPFLEISISGKYVFSEKHFTATKHSLSCKMATEECLHPSNASAVTKVYAQSLVDILTSCANSDFTPHPCKAFSSVANSSFKIQHLVVQLKQAHQEGNHCTYFSGKIRNNYSNSRVVFGSY